MHDFIQHLDEILKSTERTKDFIASPNTQNIIKLKKSHWDLNASEIVLWNLMLAMFFLGVVIAFPLFNAPPYVGVAILGAYATAMGFGLWKSVGISCVLRSWKKKAQKCALGSDFATVNDFENVTTTMQIAQKVKVVESCERAGATGEQITQLYKLTSESLPFAWWDTLREIADELYAQDYHKQQEQFAQCKHEKERCVAEDKIRVRLNVVDVETPIEHTHQSISPAQIKL